MTGVVFLVGVVAFVIVANWAYTNDRLGAGGGEQGLLAMKNESDPTDSSRRPAPRWRKVLAKPKRSPKRLRGRPASPRLPGPGKRHR
jgi:hypothetical protein